MLGQFRNLNRLLLTKINDHGVKAKRMTTTQHKQKTVLFSGEKSKLKHDCWCLIYWKTKTFKFHRNSTNWSCSSRKLLGGDSTLGSTSKHAVWWGLNKMNWTAVPLWKFYHQKIPDFHFHSWSTFNDINIFNEIWIWLSIGSSVSCSNTPCKWNRSRKSYLV